MESLTNLIILNIMIFLISSSAGKSLLEKRSPPHDDYSDEPADSAEDADLAELDQEEGECQEPFVPHVNCRSNDIYIVLSQLTSEGRFFVSDHPDDRNCGHKFSKFSKGPHLTIPFGKCGVEKSAEVHMNITVILDDEEVTTFNVTCPYRTHSSPVVDHFPQKETSHNPDQPVNVTVLPPKFTMKVTKKNPNDPKDQVVVAVIEFPPAAADVRATNCYAVAKDDPKKQRKLTNENGCPVNGFPGWVRKIGAHNLTSEFETINFFGSEQTDINCTVRFCPTASDCGPECTLADSPRRKPCRGKSH